MAEDDLDQVQDPGQDHEGEIYDKRTGQWLTERQMKHLRHKREVKEAEKIGAGIGKGVGFVASETFDVMEHVAKEAAKLERKKEEHDSRVEARREAEGRSDDEG